MLSQCTGKALSHTGLVLILNRFFFCFFRFLSFCCLSCRSSLLSAVSLLMTRAVHKLREIERDSGKHWHNGTVSHWPNDLLPCRLLLSERCVGPCTGSRPLAQHRQATVWPATDMCLPVVLHGGMPVMNGLVYHSNSNTTDRYMSGAAQQI